MIALVMGVIIGIPAALIIGKLLGKASEVLIALMGVPIVTYGFALIEGQTFIGKNVSIEGFFPESLVGLELFLGLIMAMAYVSLRTRKGLRIDDFIQISVTSLPYTSFGIALAAQYWPGFIVVGLVLIGVMVAMSLRNPLRGLNVRPCPPEVGDCLTDDDSLMSARVEGTILVGGRALKEFPKAKELVECLGRIKKPSRPRRAAIFLVSLLPILTALLPPGDITIAVGLAIALVSSIVVASLLTKRQSIPCPELAEEYREFLRKRKKKLDVRV